MKKFFIKSLGCKTNQLEGQMIAQNLLKNGFEQVQKQADADFYILNSCTVTASADSQVNYLLNMAKRKNEEVKTILAGCVVQVGGEWGADFVLDNKQKLDIAKFLSGECAEGSDFPFLEKPISTRVSVKIQDGCNNSCTYCIIPKARGKSRSNSIENIIKQIEHISKLGHKEIVLTGIHIGQWGFEWGDSLLNLLKEIEKTSIHRYRLGSLYVNEIDNELLDFLKSSKKFCPHFHLSLQSLSDPILKAMGRNYSVDDALLLIEKLHNSFDKPFLGCDIIAGFPDEGEKEFLETYENLKKAKLTKIHAFPYSKRPNTIASVMENQVHENIKKERVKMLISLSDELYFAFLNQNIGFELEVIFENKSSKTGLNRGISRNYIDIFVDDKENLKGQMINIKLHKKFLLL